MIPRLFGYIKRFILWVANWVVAVLQWLFVHENRITGVRNTRKFLAVLELASRLTPSKTDDFAIGVIKMAIEKTVKELPAALGIQAIETVNKKVKGAMKEVHIGYDEQKGLNAGLNFKF